MADELSAHGLVILALLKRVAGAVTVFIERQCAVGESLPDIVSDDGFLVFDGYIVAVQLFVNRNAAVSCYGVGLYQCYHLYMCNIY